MFVNSPSCAVKRNSPEFENGAFVNVFVQLVAHNRTIMSQSGSNAIEEVSPNDFYSHKEFDKQQNDGKVICYNT